MKNYNTIKTIKLKSKDNKPYGLVKVTVNLKRKSRSNVGTGKEFEGNY